MRGIIGRTALVTGAGRGIGRAIALRLATDGANVVINDLDQDVASEVADLITAGGRGAVAIGGSVADPHVCESVVDAARAGFGQLDIVVNNAGFTSDAWVTKMTDEAWSSVLDVMLTGPFQICRAAGPLLRGQSDDADRPNRKVVNVASVNGIYGAAGQANYAAAKAGLVGLTKALAREWARQAINVNAVAPGYIAGTRLTTEGRGDVATGLPADVVAALERSIPIGRPGTPQDVAGVVAFLASADSDYVVGQVVEVHGGREIIEVA